MQPVHWSSRLADAGALACAGALFVAIALEVPVRAEPDASAVPTAASAGFAPVPSEAIGRPPMGPPVAAAVR